MSKKSNKPSEIKQNFTMQQKIKQFYSKSIKRYYVYLIAGFFIGAKVCDFIFYDPVKLQIVREQMQDQFWALNGQPKHLKPKIVQSFANPTVARKSWIQIIYGKDKYIPKE